MIAEIIALKFKRKIVIIGRSMENAVQISRAFGYIKVPDSEIIESQDIKQYKNNELLILCTGSQGEPMAQLARIANGEHKDVHIIPGDTVVFSSSAIPGNGILIDHVVNLLTRSGADVKMRMWRWRTSSSSRLKGSSVKTPITTSTDFRLMRSRTTRTNLYRT